MTYARARLLLGIIGVGSVVVLSTVLLLVQLPLTMLPDARRWSGADLAGLISLFGCLVAALFPFDLIGGFVLPNRWRPDTVTLGRFLLSWLRGVAVQGVLFIGSSLWILLMGRWLGVAGAAFAVASVAIFLVASQLQVAKLVAALPTRLAVTPDTDPAIDGVGAATDGKGASRIAQSLTLASRWGWRERRTVVLHHHDTGFTGGIAGLPGMETVVLPSESLNRLTPEGLAITIARRLEAIQSGSRTRGLLLAVIWVTTGFALSAMLPGAGVTSVGQLAMTCLGFTLWTFLGLLTLPTLSRQASYAIDGKVLSSGVSSEIFRTTLKTLDALQDDEPRRPALIETVFHPVPSVHNREAGAANAIPIAWHAARMTLFVSWACMGLLVRAVHCNVGRPELWVMLPTD